MTTELVLANERTSISNRLTAAGTTGVGEITSNQINTRTHSTIRYLMQFNAVNMQLTARSTCGLSGGAVRLSKSARVVPCIDLTTVRVADSLPNAISNVASICVH